MAATNKATTTGKKVAAKKRSKSNAVVGKSAPPRNMSGARDWVDAWGKQTPPNAYVQIHEYSLTCYACANVNAESVSKTPLRLYARLPQWQKTVWASETLSRKRLDYVTSKIGFRASGKVEEITDHLFLDLLHHPNPHWTWHELINFTQLYLEIVGRCYWYVQTDLFGRPKSLWLLPPHYVTPIRGDDGFPRAYSYAGNTYDKDEVLVFTFADLYDPYIEGRSPVRAAWESLQIDDKFRASLLATLDNECRPGLIVSFPEGGPAEETFDRDEQLFNAKLSRAGTGGAVFVDDAVNITPLTFPGRDLAALQIGQDAFSKIVRCFAIPLALMDTKDANRANMIASKALHAEQAVIPRLRRIEAKVNGLLKKWYEPSGRLFVCFDDPTPEMAELKQAELSGYVASGVITANEAREEIGYAPVAGGDTLVGNFNWAGDSTPDKPAEEPQATEPASDTPDENATGQELQTLPSTVLNGAQVTSALQIVSAVANGQLPRDSALGMLQTFFNLSPEQAAQVMGGVGNGFQIAPPDAPQATPGDDSQPEAQSDQQSKTTPCSHGCKPLTAEAHKAWKSARSRVPDGKQLLPILHKFFAKQREQILGELSKHVTTCEQKGVKARLPEKFIPLKEWVDDLANDSQPVIEILFAQGGKQLIQRVGASADVFNVTNPKLKQAIKNLTLKFCEETNKTTTDDLNNALTTLRQEFSEGLIEGDRMTELTDRVGKIFDEAEQYRSHRIAQTEASRAHHEGLREAAKASGVVKGFELLLSSEACPVCVAVKEQTPVIGLDGSFAGAGGNEVYPDSLLPIHPNCECTVLEVLDISATEVPDDEGQ